MRILFRGEDGKRKNRARTLGKAARCHPAKALVTAIGWPIASALVYIPPRVLIYSRGGRIDFVTVQGAVSSLGTGEP
jgi:hypothetical protein